MKGGRFRIFQKFLKYLGLVEEDHQLKKLMNIRSKFEIVKYYLNTSLNFVIIEYYWQLTEQ